MKEEQLTHDREYILRTNEGLAGNGQKKFG